MQCLRHWPDQGPQTSHSLACEVTAKPAGLRCAREQLNPGMAKEQQREGEGGGDSPGEAGMNAHLRWSQAPAGLGHRGSSLGRTVEEKETGRPGPFLGNK